MKVLLNMKYSIVLLLVFNFVQYGQTYQMNINLKSGNKFSIPIEEIQKLTFETPIGIKDLQNLQTIIETFRVSQNYPNPFGKTIHSDNANTTISYQISKPTQVKILIYDIQGSLVKELYDNFQDKGEYKIQWDGTNQHNQRLSSGMYIYTVMAENKTISKQMILLK